MEQLLCHLWGDYILQSDWMAQNKTKRFAPACIHATLYMFCFLPLLSGHTVWSFLIIQWSHFAIDRWRLARYMVWAKNFIAPSRLLCGPPFGPMRYYPWIDCHATGYFRENPVWLSTWLLIIADNVLHLTINYAALRWF